MTIFETIGACYVIFAACCSTAWFGIAIYKHTRRCLDLQLRGEVEEKRDVRRAGLAEVR